MLATAPRLTKLPEIAQIHPGVSDPLPALPRTTEQADDILMPVVRHTARTIFGVSTRSYVQDMHEGALTDVEANKIAV